MKVTYQRKTKFDKMSVESWGLNPGDADSHTPEFFVITKTLLDKTFASIQRGARSAEGEAKREESTHN